MPKCLSTKQPNVIDEHISRKKDRKKKEGIRGYILSLLVLIILADYVPPICKDFRKSHCKTSSEDGIQAPYVQENP